MSDFETPQAAREMRQKFTGLRRLWPAVENSVAGLRTACHSEPAFRQELAGFCILIPVAIWFGEGAVERVLLIGTLMLVLITELLNTAVEYTVNRFGWDYNDMTKAAKDTGSAAVFLSLILAGLTWVSLLLFP